MNNQFSNKVSDVLSFSREEAERLLCDSVAPEHIFLGLLRNTDPCISKIFAHFHLNPAQLKYDVEEYIRQQQENANHIVRELVLNEHANNVLRLAVLEARIFHQKNVEVNHLLLALLHDSADNGAKRVFEDNGVDYDVLRNIMLKKADSTPKNGIGMTEDESESEDDESVGSSASTGKAKHPSSTTKMTGKTPVLDNFSTDLTAAAAESKLDPVVGREKEIQRVSEILGRRKKNNPILIGEPGVGKSAIVEGLAQLIVSQRTSPILFGKRVVSLDMTGLVAGTKYRGQFEERIRALIKELEANPNIIVFMDEIHTIIGAGNASGSMDAANILKPALARGAIQCIGATTLDEYRNSIEKDGALERRFQKILVEPTSPTETLQILHNIKERYENHHHVIYTEQALEACVRLTDRYINDRYFPDKAIDALDEVGARMHLQQAHVPAEVVAMQKDLESIKKHKQQAVQSQNFELAASYRDRQAELAQRIEELRQEWLNGTLSKSAEITEENVAEVVSKMSGVPVQRVNQNEGSYIKGMAGRLKGVVIGQDGAVDKVVKAILRNRMGLKDANRPIGTFMFLGPTGVGKTFLAKKLAEEMFGDANTLIRIDMSEYSESFNTSRLVGAPPGYVGFEEGGQLTERVRRHPYSIVLLDEIEKAHGSIFNMLLQVLDEGRLTDGNGRLVDFRNTVIIMTSNAGTRQLKEFGQGVGFTANNFNAMFQDEKDKEYARGIIQKSLSKQFAPEFLNRLDEIVTFDQLNFDAIKSIIDLELRGLVERVESLGCHITISDKAKQFVASKGYDVQFGARPLKRAIQTYIEDGVCELLIENNEVIGSTIVVGKCPKGDSLTFKISTSKSS